MSISEIAMTVFVVAMIVACLFGPYVISIGLAFALGGAFAYPRGHARM